MQKIHEKFAGKGVQVLGVNFQELEGTDADAYLKSKGGAYLTLLNSEKMAEAYGVTSVPVFLVINRNGKVVFAALQYNPNIGNELEAAAVKALSENSSSASLAGENKH